MLGYLNQWPGIVLSGGLLYTVTNVMLNFGEMIPFAVAIFDSNQPED